GVPSLDDRWRETGGGGIGSGVENSPDTLIVVSDKQAAVRRHRDIDQRKVDWPAIGVARTRLGAGQRFHRCLPTRPGPFQKERHQPPSRRVLIVRFLFPAIITDDERVAISLRELIVLVEYTPGWRAAAHIENARQTINVVRRIGADLLPALVTSNGPV